MDGTRQQQELSWYKETQLVHICSELRSNLQAGKDDEVDSKDPVMKLKDTRLLQFEGSEKEMKGFLVLEGCNVSEAEIILSGKLLKLRNSPFFKTSIQSTNPYPLSQIQNIYNYLYSALSVLSKQLFSCDGNILEDKSDLIADLPILDILMTLDEVSQLVQSAKSQLLLPTPMNFPKNSTQIVFQPPLPADALLEFKVKNKMLVINFIVMHPVPNPASNISQDRSERKTYFSKRQNQTYEVAEQVTVECKVHKLDTIYNFVQQSWHLCSELQEKLSILGVVQ